MLVSIIVPVWNDESRILECINALQKQSLARQKYEILVVDNGSTDSTYDILKNVSGIELLQETKPGSYAARNLGIKHAKGKFLAFTDSDCIANSNWLIELLNIALEKENLGLVAGKVRFFEPQGEQIESCAMDFETLFSMDQEANAKCGRAITANWLFSKALAEHYGGFDDDLKSGGDYALSSKISSSGLDVYFAPKAIVLHPARNRVQLIQKRRRVVGGNWDKHQSRFVFFQLIVSASKVSAKRILQIVLQSKLPMSRKNRLSALVLHLWFVSISEISRLSLGKSAERS